MSRKRWAAFQQLSAAFSVLIIFEHYATLILFLTSPDNGEQMNLNGEQMNLKTVLSSTETHGIIIKSYNKQQIRTLKNKRTTKLLVIPQLVNFTRPGCGQRAIQVLLPKTRFNSGFYPKELHPTSILSLLFKPNPEGLCDVWLPCGQICQSKKNVPENTCSHVKLWEVLQKHFPIQPGTSMPDMHRVSSAVALARVEIWTLTRLCAALVQFYGIEF